ncbi:flagellar hook-basal body complex protein FliE [Sphingomonas sp. CFBP 8760]|uniref:flagellar hook-basal body complex protein FliE n=1 Tax=Sphingomonas sp. CFBP 8760 TaxID=2775282 RepID=UPI001782E3A2|nr:flagellar hook-basal body complex protein FliE [Sphingomonas sp. CFBP 8760]MBD8545654.1 flagellar hook-basal body complex protein FliE [Sphingomonas sp. CFBP 8760]
MSIGALDAAAAYGRALGVGKTGGAGIDIGKTGSGGAGAAGAAGGFGNMVESMVGNAATSMRAAEAASAKQVAGKGDLIDVVTAMGAAETALDTVVAVRDRMVAAYSDIMRMQI